MSLENQIQNGSTVAFATLLLGWLYKHGSRTGKELTVKEKRIQTLYEQHLSSSVEVAVSRRDLEAALQQLEQREKARKTAVLELDEAKKETFLLRDSLQRAEERIITTTAEIEALQMLLKAAHDELEILKNDTPETNQDE